MKVCRICLLEVGEDVKFQDLHKNGLKLEWEVNNSLPEVSNLKNFNSIICNQCIVKIIGTESYIKQEPEEYVVDVIKNELCDLEVITEDVLINADIPVCIEDQVYYCHDCSYCTKIKNSLDAHVFSQHKKKQLQCDHCNYSTKSKITWKNHLLLHTNNKDILKYQNIKQFQCEVCNFRTRSKCYLRKHIMLHQRRKKKLKSTNMEENGAKVCRICFLKIGEGVKFHYLNRKGLKLQWKLTESLPEIDLNPVICNQCVTEIIGIIRPAPIKQEPDAERDMNIINDILDCIKQEPGVEKIKEEYGVRLINEVTRYVRSVENSTYCCYDCGYGSKTKSYLVQHIFTHHKRKKFQCDQCDYSTFRKPWLKKHLATRYACNHCGFTTFCYRSLQRHEESHASNLNRLKHHKTAYQNVTPLLTNISTSSKQVSKVYNCAHCTFSSSKRQRFQRHVVTHNKVKLFKCDQCDYSTNRSCSLKLHMHLHFGVKNLKCDKCDYSCARKDYLIKHMGIWHSKGQLVKRYKCKECEYVTTYKPFLRPHTWSHTNVKSFRCSQCNYASSQEYYLKVHMHVHTREKPLKCDKCDFECSYVSGLTYHQRTHSGKKPYKCHLCSYSAVKNQSLTGHIRAHLRKPIINCEKCDFKTLHRRDMEKHELTCNKVRKMR